LGLICKIFFKGSLFETVGEVVGAKIVYKQNSSLGYGFVEMKDENSFIFNLLLLYM
jgi:hypothetical protein